MADSKSNAGMGNYMPADNGLVNNNERNGVSRGLYLQWEGKRVYRQRVPTPRLLEPVEKYSFGTERPNMLVEGDNLQVLASLKPRYTGQVDVVYIDAPYNLGKDDFRYSDKRFHDPDADDSDAVYVTNEDGVRHTKWLNFMAPRVYMLWQLLHEERGVLFLSINDVELFRIGMLLNEILGEENWIGTVVWHGNTDNNPTRIAIEHEYVLCYAKSKDRLAPRWTNPATEIKTLMLDAFDRIKAESPSLADIQKHFKAFTDENRAALGDLYRYRRVDEHGPYADEACASPGPDRFLAELGGRGRPAAGRRRPDARGATPDHRPPHLAVAGGDRGGDRGAGLRRRSA
jgi:adenine-specific DNA-methyltransferase